MTAPWLTPIRDAAVAISQRFGPCGSVSSATPLMVLKQEGMAAVIEKLGPCPPCMRTFFSGSGRCIGETSVILILIGGIYLMVRKSSPHLRLR